MSLRERSVSVGLCWSFPTGGFSAIREGYLREGGITGKVSLA